MAHKIMPTTYFMILLLSSLGFYFLPFGKFSGALIASSALVLGTMLIAFGVWLNLWTDRRFKKMGVSVKPHHTPRHLDTMGPFKFSRHPMYLGMASILLGTTLLMRSVVGLIFPVIFVVLMETIFIPMEERNLHREFKDAYSEYKKRVRRWI